MQMALEALANAEDHCPKPYSTDCRRSANALRVALSAQQEPVAWMDDEESGTCNVCGGLLRYGERHRKCGEAVMRAVAEEREQCARLCDEAAKSNEETTARLRWPLEHLAAQIRARYWRHT